ncbi:MAG TPA: hypothetical protein VH436_30735 [Vicinamibacterales bacterium]|jgi:hypothetical protein
MTHRIPQLLLQAGPSDIVAALAVAAFGLMLLDAFIARFRRPRVRMARVEPTYQTDGGCYSDF